ncbi:MAG: hypothetical protein WC356_02060 [Candidatus Micrarchaeia archaeon]|jgi:hypothetical protein
MSERVELRRQIEISSPCVIAETKRLYYETTCKMKRQGCDDDPQWTEAIEALPDTTKICNMNVMVREIMIDVVKKARWNCWINGELKNE